MKLAERSAVAIEQAVAGFRRLHRYTHGAVLRTRAMDVWESAVRAWRQRDRQARLVEQLSEKIDSLKLAMQLGKQINAFRSVAEFEAVYRIVALRAVSFGEGGRAEDIVNSCITRQGRGQPLSEKQQQAIYNIVHRFRRQITDRLVIEYAAVRAMGAD